jgi:hypothetical protein
MQMIRKPRYPDLVVAVAIAIAALVIVLLDVLPVIRVIVIIPLALFLPGYAIVSAVVPSGPPPAVDPLPGVEKTVAAIGLSIALTIFVGLALAFVNLGLSPVSWAASLTLLTSLTALIAWRRRLRRGQVARLPAVGRPRRREVATLTVAMISVIVVLVSARWVAMNQQPSTPVQLWALPVDETPTEIRMGVIAGTVPADYVLRVTSAGALVDEYPISLQSGQRWEKNLILTDEQQGRPTAIRLLDTAGNELRFVVIQPPPDGG